MRPRILIVTAAFGEGHNSAARNFARAAEELGAECLVEDPCMLGIPFTTSTLCKGYRLVTTHLPELWHRIYQSTGDVDFSRKRLPLMRKPERKLRELVETFKPHAIVSTYPLYPYFLERTFGEIPQLKVPIFTVVTDSLEINSAWLKAKTDAWLVTDKYTRQAMIDASLPAASIIDTGFSVHPKFSRVETIQSDSPASPFDVLYFATPKKPHVRRTAKAVLKAHPDTRITIILGRNVRLLYKRAKEIKERFPGRVRILGWTRRVPDLLASHHLVIGKAGGATVHESIAAQCPMFIHHLVPGQEEGNLKLLQKIGGGALTETPEILCQQVTELLQDNAAKWRDMKRALNQHNRNSGALIAAKHVIDHCKPS